MTLRNSITDGIVAGGAVIYYYTRNYFKIYQSFDYLRKTVTNGNEGQDEIKGRKSSESNCC
jgi:hypothetical protein